MQESTRAREHLANERTLLAWVRTAIALMGLGFVIARFGLFLRELAVEQKVAPSSDVGLSAVIGMALVLAGLLAVVLSTVRFARARVQIEESRFEPEVFAEVVVVTLTVLAGSALLIYLAITR